MRGATDICEDSQTTVTSFQVDLADILAGLERKWVQLALRAITEYRLHFAYVARRERQAKD